MPNPPDDAPKEPVTVALPVSNAAARVGAAAGLWLDALSKLGRDSELVIVDDGSTDGTATEAEKLTAAGKPVRVLRHETRRGFGACLRTALDATTFPLFAYSALDYPYTPADLSKLLDRLDETDAGLGRKIDAVSGCRTGRPMPLGWKAVGTGFRMFCRVALGLPLDPLPAWLGFRAHLRSWVTWVVLGNPLVDVDSAFKVFRRSVFDRFPIQSDGDFVHAEVIAKATFTACIMDELPLTPRVDPLPPTWWSDFMLVLKNAKFHPPKPPAPVEPPAPVPS